MLVGTSERDDIVVGAVTVDGTLHLASRGGVVGAVGLDDIVLDQGTASPAVYGEVTVSAGVVGTRVADISV